jgi:hypothetical protein
MKTTFISIITFLVLSYNSNAQELYVGHQFAGNLQERNSDFYPFGFDMTCILFHKIIISSGFSYGRFNEHSAWIKGKTSKTIFNLNTGYLYKKIGVSVLWGIQFDKFNGVFTSDESSDFIDVYKSNLFYGATFHYFPLKKIGVKVALMNFRPAKKIWLSSDYEYQLGISYRITKN